ncbi:MAG: hypothetical protein WC791_01480 [Candidatus Paceibacterota bacterium]|jgi:hypothetical protein
MLRKIESFIAWAFVYAVLLFGGIYFFLCGDSPFEHGYPMLGFLARMVLGMVFTACGCVIFATFVSASLVVNLITGLTGAALFFLGIFTLKKVYTT